MNKALIEKAFAITKVIKKKQQAKRVPKQESRRTASEEHDTMATTSAIQQVTTNLTEAAFILAVDYLAL